MLLVKCYDNKCFICYRCRLDEINSTLNSSERHLTGIKSVFGGIRNYLFAKRNGIQTTATSQGQIATSVASESSPAQPRATAAFVGNEQRAIDNYHPG